VARARLLLLPPLLLFFAWVAAVDGAAWRLWLVAVAMPLLGLFVVVEYRRWRRVGFRPGAVERNLSVAVLGHLALSAASGGALSPFLPFGILLAVLAGLLASRRAAYVLLGVQLLGLWAITAAALLAAVPDLNLRIFGGGPRGGHVAAEIWARAVVLSAFLAVARGVGRAVRRAYDRALRRSLDGQRDALRAHAEREEELTALSAEIAHELKNPLASVKGLAGLLDGGLADAKGAERLGVLRREVDRMQAILDEFLNFSRPLVPLALGRVDLAPLAREVAALHEGLAHERGVALALRAAPATARCDPRKVKQLLVNLVQNALEASGPGGQVEIETEVRGAEARVRILDRGRGPEAHLGERVFDAGVTTKPSGSGLGLPIARALARQHGGELTLAAREGGGAVAELVLPAAPPEGREGRAA
jgi:signal transduction histidine kinase